MRKASDMYGRIRGTERILVERDGRNGMSGYEVGRFVVVKILMKVLNTVH